MAGKPYQIKIWKQVAEDLETKPAAIVEAIVSHIERLRRDPVGLSRKSFFPYWPNHQLYQFSFVWDGVRHWVTILFKFELGETTIQIRGISHQSSSRVEEDDE